MDILLNVLQILFGVVVIVSILMQDNKSDALSGLVHGGQTESFYSKNKGKTKDSMLMKTTAISMFLFMVNTLLINIV